MSKATTVKTSQRSTKKHQKRYKGSKRAKITQVAGGENQGQTEPLIMENQNANSKDYGAAEEEKTPLLSMTALSLNSSV